MQEYLNYIESHLWELITICVSPLLGFILAQYYKNYLRNLNKPIILAKIALLNGFSTAALAAWFWPGSFDESVKLGVILGITAPLIVWVYFVIASRWAPKQIDQFKGDTSDSDLTIIPWVFKKKNTPPTYDSTVVLSPAQQRLHEEETMEKQKEREKLDEIARKKKK